MISVPRTTNWLTDFIADIPTPFDSAGDIDLPSLVTMCERQIRVGASAIVVGETAGEMSTLSLREHARLVEAAALTARGRIRVIACAGSNATAQAVAMARQSEAAGADAVISVAPYYNKPTQAGIEAHFRAIADAVDLPVILHDNPARTVKSIADDTLVRLVASRSFAGLCDSSGDLTRLLRIKPQLPPEFRLLSGDDATALAFLQLGGHGCVSMTANIVPGLCRDLYCYSRLSRMRSAQSLALRLAPLTAMIAADCPARLKYALSLLELMSPEVRLPMIQPDDGAKLDIAQALAPFGYDGTFWELYRKEA